MVRLTEERPDDDKVIGAFFYICDYERNLSGRGDGETEYGGGPDIK
ncbi:MAG: hypothetical protein ACI4PP_05275 [Clostridia bacterium]